MLVQKRHWHAEADVIIVGCGAAGAAAAIAAHDAGSQVIVLEKQQAPAPYNNSFMSGGAFIGTAVVEALTAYMEALSVAGEGLRWTDRETIRTWAEQSSIIKSRLEQMGAALELFSRGGAHKLRGAESVDIYRFAGAGPGMMRFLLDQMGKRKIPILPGVKAVRILQDSQRQVVGVEGQRLADHQTVNVGARRALILATGGFEFDEHIKLQYLKVHPCHFVSSPWNTGDGIKMGIEVGAQLWHMNCSIAACVMKFPEFAAGMTPLFGGRHWLNPALSALPAFGGEGWRARHVARRIPAAGYIITDRYGKRYADENIKGHEFLYDMAVFDSKRLLFPRVPSYWIFDDKRMSSGPLRNPVRAPRPRPAHIYNWSTDNGEELERGWIQKGDTVKELADKLEIKADVLTKTVRQYNVYCENGRDKEFDREPGTLVPLYTPPYYAVQLWPGGLNTLGGPRRNARAQIMGADGLPIPRLYGAGELGSVHGMLYPGTGGNLAECLGLGQLAGVNAAECRPL